MRRVALRCVENEISPASSASGWSQNHPWRVSVFTPVGGVSWLPWFPGDGARTSVALAWFSANAAKSRRNPAPSASFNNEKQLGSAGVHWEICALSPLALQAPTEKKKITEISWDWKSATLVFDPQPTSIGGSWQRSPSRLLCGGNCWISAGFNGGISWGPAGRWRGNSAD